MRVPFHFEYNYIWTKENPQKLLENPIDRFEGWCNLKLNGGQYRKKVLVFGFMSDGNYLK